MNTPIFREDLRGEGIWAVIVEQINLIGRVLNNIRGEDGTRIQVSRQGISIAGGGKMTISGTVRLYGKWIGFTPAQIAAGLKRYLRCIHDGAVLSTEDVMPDPWPPGESWRDLWNCSGDIYLP